MPEITNVYLNTNMENSGLFRLNLNDLVRGVAAAFGGCVLYVIVTVGNQLFDSMNVPGFDYAAFDWGQLINWAKIAFSSYLAKNFLTTKDQKLGGLVSIG